MKKQRYMAAIAGCIAFFVVICLFHNMQKQQQKQTNNTASKASPATTASLEPTLTPEPMSKQSIPPEQIYSYFQGPKCWESRKTWSGSWGKLRIDGNNFGSFGCGLCCMANIYSTLTDYVCSPVDMYHYAKEVSSYYPTYGAGAIDWNAMKTTLEHCGFSLTLHKKGKSKKDFEADIKQAACTIVLVSSYYDDSFWTNTPGHYVVIWNYNAQDHTIFLTDSGSPERNRQSVPVGKVYRALKLSSTFQYATIDDYTEKTNQWLWDAVSEKWIAP